jgi:hypothetical protein
VGTYKNPAESPTKARPKPTRTKDLGKMKGQGPRNKKATLMLKIPISILLVFGNLSKILDTKAQLIRYPEVQMLYQKPTWLLSTP